MVGQIAALGYREIREGREASTGPAVVCGIKLNEFGRRLHEIAVTAGGGRLGCERGDEEVGPFRFSVAQSWVGFCAVRRPPFAKRLGPPTKEEPGLLDV